MEKSRIFGLDLLRAVAISLVIISHTTYFFVYDSDNPLVLILRTLGAIGVDLFFVLSGFLIGGLLLKEIDRNHIQFQHLFRFWKRRWFRTLPNYFLMLTVNVVLILIFAGGLPKNIEWYPLFLQNFSSPHPDFFTEAWSLSIEEYAYLLLPAVMFCGFYIFKNNSKSVFLWTTLTVILLGFILKFHYYLNVDSLTFKAWSSEFRKVVVYRMDSIYVGFLLVYAMHRFPEFFKTYKNSFLAFGMVIFVTVHFIIYKMQLDPESNSIFYIFLYLPLISLCCASLFPFAQSMKGISVFKPLVYFISTRSYAMYLVNFSIILLTIQYFFPLESISNFFKVILSIVYLTLTIGLSNLVYIYFEKPILRYRDRKL